MPIRAQSPVPKPSDTPSRMAFLGFVLALAIAPPALAAEHTPPPALRCVAPAADRPVERADPDAPPPRPQALTDVWTEGSVTVGGAAIDYCAVAGTLIVHPKDWDDAAPAGDAAAKSDSDDNAKNPATAASMFYVAYLKRVPATAVRPVTFLFNGGPGSASVWLHMGAMGPRRVETADATHTTGAPYRLVNNDHSLIDASDLVFIDAPGTGFSRVTGPDKDKAFYGVDQDAHAFAEFITTFLTKYHRWNSPKYLFGESYGTTRAAVLVNRLQGNPGMDINGLILLSQVLAADFNPDQPKTTPGNDLPYQLGLPTLAATAWYHRQPPEQRSTEVPIPLLREVERFAMGEYAAALAAGSSLDQAARDQIVTKLHEFTGLPEEYLRRADLRVSADEFRQELLRDRDLIIGGTDTRFAGHSLDRMSRKAKYDPSDAAVGSAYISTFNDYARRVLKSPETRSYRTSVDDIGDKWDYSHQPPDGAGNGPPFDQTANVLPDLAKAMKLNPLLKVQLNAGYFDLLTPYFQGRYEMRHLPIPPVLRSNIEYRCYRSGHLVYLKQEALARLHDNVADFITRTDNLPPPPGKHQAAAAECPSDQGRCCSRAIRIGTLPRSFVPASPGYQPR
jgi:carboxypeptidase C (cathepsin A)